MNCPLCQSEKIIAISGGFRGVVQCASCQFIYAQQSANSSAPELYSEQWAQSVVHPTFVYSNGTFVSRNADKMAVIIDRLKSFRKLNRMLDVGCSAAFFLKIARDHGWQVQGVEVADFGVKFSREKLGIDVFQGMLQDAHFSDASFDAVTSSHVIEHVADPRSLIREMKRVLRPGGALVTVLPTQYSARWFGKLRGEGPPRHVSYFTKSTFERLLREEGFQVHFSCQNIELQELFASVRSSHKSIPASSTNVAGTVSAGTLSPLIRFVKFNINCIGTMLGIGDELVCIGIKA